ncbi:hypothetical protein ASE00_07525 [Sphingomonas sp. Root710]|nr:hypothetical protein ASE00_07525 [Sphingomonas sp. Root710]
MESQRLRFCEAAMACFSRKGVAASNLNDICEEAGLSMGALYKHFSSREDLLEAILQLRSERRNAMLRGETWLDLRSALVNYWRELQGLPFWREFQGVSDWSEQLRKLRLQQARLILMQIQTQLEGYMARGEINPPFDLARTAQLVSIIFDGSSTGIRSSGELHIMLEDLAAYLDFAVGSREVQSKRRPG